MQHITLLHGELAPQHFNKIRYFCYKYALEQPLPNPYSYNENEYEKPFYISTYSRSNFFLGL
jgi:hypothetical protein